MHILSDFDGVWTDQAGEAQAIQRGFAADAAKLIGLPEDEAWSDFCAFRSATLAEPHAHGWWPRGYLTAFVDEDELLATGAVSYWLDNHASHPSAERWLRAFERAGFASAEAFANAQFGPAMVAYRKRGAHGLVAEAEQVLADLTARGVSLVVVSNSPTEKLRSMFEERGITEHDGLRLVGDARKWWIESAEPHREIAGRHVHLDRPHYRAILEREQPDVVIGDVASLDLALPAQLRNEGQLPATLRLLLRGHPLMSTWASLQVELAQSERVVDEVVDSISSLAL